MIRSWDISAKQGSATGGVGLIERGVDPREFLPQHVERPRPGRTRRALDALGLEQAGDSRQIVLTAMEDRFQGHRKIAFVCGERAAKRLTPEGGPELGVGNNRHVGPSTFVGQIYCRELGLWVNTVGCSRGV